MTWSSIFTRPCGGRIELARVAVDTLLRFRQLDPGAVEAGGILLGRLLVDSADVVVDVAVSPGARDVRGIFRFERQRGDAQQRVDQEWRDSLGTRVYLGDWHSHPEEDPHPSSVDLANWRTLLRRTKCEQEFLLFPIVGRGALRIWEARRDTGAIVEALVFHETRDVSTVE
jgi:integrative and conjugative element protein (TIGR02256 family)